MKRFLGKIFWYCIVVLVVSEQPAACSNCPEKVVKLKSNLLEAGGCVTANCRTKRESTDEAWHLANVTASENRFKGLLEKVNELHESYQQSMKVLNILQKVLVAVRQYLDVTTIALFGSTETISFKDIFLESHVPLLIVKNKVDWHIVNRFNRNIFSIILLPADHAAEENQLFKALKQTLKGFHLKKIVVIKESFLAAEQNNRLLNWFHAKGFWQTLLMDLEGNTLALQHFTGELLHNLTLEEFMLAHVKWHNLQGVTVNCSMGLNPPRTFVQYDAHNQIILKGFFGSVVSLFAQHYNVSLRAFFSQNYTELNCVKYVSNGRLDICSEPLPYRYHEQYLVTYPEELVNSYLMVPYGKPLDNFYYFLNPFQADVWLILFVSFFYEIITLSFFHRLQHGSWNCGLQVLQAISSVLYLPFRLTHIKWPYRGFLEIIMICLGLVVAPWYLSALSSHLFTRLFSQDINSVRDLRDHNITILLDEFEYFMLNSSEIDPIMRQQMKMVPNDVLLEHRRNLDPHYAYYSQYDKIDFYLYQQKFLQRPRLKVLTPAVNTIVGGIPMRPDWPFQHILNAFFRHLLESGVYIRLYEDALAEGIYSGYLQYLPTEYQRVEALSVEYFQMPAMLLAVGYIFAILAFLLELLVSKICS